MKTHHPHRTGWCSATLLSLFLCVCLGGCNLHFDLESVEAPDSTQDAVNDTSRDTDTSDEDSDTEPPSDTGTDGGGDTASVDTGDASDSSGQDTGDVVEDTVDPSDELDTACSSSLGNPRCDLGVLEGNCNPLLCNECGVNETCSLQLRFANGNPDAFVSACVASDDIADGKPGDECTSTKDDCGPRTLCVTWNRPDPRGRVCSRLCELQSGLGCPENWFCTNPLPDTLQYLGVCTRSCDPRAVDSCPAGQACALDPNYPDQTCVQNFRCLENGGFSGKSQDDECDPAELHQNGCPPKFLCAEDSDADAQHPFTCQAICQQDTDCGSVESCQEASAGIMTCQ